MNKIEYWFLDAAIRLKIPFHWLSARNVDELLNRPHHNLSTSELLAVLESMFERGDLFLEYVDRSGQTYQTQTPLRSEIEAALSLNHAEWLGQAEKAFFGVTHQGGAQWEARSHPRWEYFFDEAYGMNPDKGEMTASTRELIEERLAIIPYDSFIRAIVSESIQWSVHQPWEATYWKKLPIGYHIEFTYVPLSEVETRARVTRPDRVQTWYERVHRWYESEW